MQLTEVAQMLTLAVAEAAALLGVPSHTVEAWAGSGIRGWLMPVIAGGSISMARSPLYVKLDSTLSIASAIQTARRASPRRQEDRVGDRHQLAS
jgi:hypothetical protein